MPISYHAFVQRHAHDFRELVREESDKRRQIIEARIYGRFEILGLVDRWSEDSGYVTIEGFVAENVPKDKQELFEDDLRLLKNWREAFDSAIELCGCKPEIPPELLALYKVEYVERPDKLNFSGLTYLKARVSCWGVYLGSVQTAVIRLRRGADGAEVIRYIAVTCPNNTVSLIVSPELESERHAHVAAICYAALGYSIGSVSQKKKED